MGRECETKACSLSDGDTYIHIHAARIRNTHARKQKLSATSQVTMTRGTRNFVHEACVLLRSYMRISFASLYVVYLDYIHMVTSAVSWDTLRVLAGFLILSRPIPRTGFDQR
jgi:hypothetical protein